MTLCFFLLVLKSEEGALSILEHTYKRRQELLHDGGRVSLGKSVGASAPNEVKGKRMQTRSFDRKHLKIIFMAIEILNLEWERLNINIQIESPYMTYCMKAIVQFVFSSFRRYLLLEYVDLNLDL